MIMVTRLVLMLSELMAQNSDERMVQGWIEALALGWIEMGLNMEERGALSLTEKVLILVVAMKLDETIVQGLIVVVT